MTVEEKSINIKVVILSVVKISVYNKLRLFIGILGVLSISTIPSCSSSSNETNDLAPESILYQEFANFPEMQFLQLHFGMETVQAEEVLKANDFELSYQDETKHYIRKSDSIEVFIPDWDQLLMFRVFLKNGSYLSKKVDFYSFLCKKASKIEENDEICILEFNTINGSYKMSWFSQKDYIRLKFSQP